MTGPERKGPGRSKGRVLLVEDSRVQAEKMTRVLAGDGYEVTLAADGATAIKLARDARPDLVLLDMVLPDKSGAEVLRIVKAVTGQFVPVIILSANSDLESRVKGLQMGAEDYIGKDADPTEILARVWAMRRIKQLQDELRTANERLEQLSVTDGLTGLTNHRHFQVRLREEVGRALRHGDPLSLLMIDLDHFKSVNDRWLHPFGDKVLRETAGLIRNSLREHDLSARYGGEEFSVILPKALLTNALQVARRIGGAIAAHPFVADGFTDPETGKAPVVRVTCSIGAASLPSGDITGAEALVKRADEALFKAKHGGRNRIWAFQGQFFEDGVPAPAGP